MCVCATCTHSLADALLALEADSAVVKLHVLRTLVLKLKTSCSSGVALGTLMRLLQDRVLGPGT